MANNPFSSDPLANIQKPDFTLPELPEIPQPQIPTIRKDYSQNEMLGMFTEAAIRHQVPVNVLMAMAEAESGFDVYSTSRGKGLMQFTDADAELFGIDPFDPKQSIDAAARILANRIGSEVPIDEAVIEFHAGKDRESWNDAAKKYGATVIQRAKDLADLFPEPPMTEPEVQLKPYQEIIATEGPITWEQYKIGMKSIENSYRSLKPPSIEALSSIKQSEQNLIQLREQIEQQQRLIEEKGADPDSMATLRAQSLIYERRRQLLLNDLNRYNQDIENYNGALEQLKEAEKIIKSKEQVDLDATFTEEFRDTVAAWGIGSAALLDIGGSIFGLFSGDMENWGTKNAEMISDYYSGMKSDAWEQANTIKQNRIDAQEGQFDKFKTALYETIKSPELFSSFIVEQIPMLATTGGAGVIAGRVAQVAGAAPKLVSLSNIGTQVLTGALMQGGDVGGDVYQQIMSLNDLQVKVAANKAYQALIKDGVPHDVAERQVALELSRLAAIKSGVLSLGLQALIPSARTIEKTFSGIKDDAITPLQGAIRGGLGEGLTEGAEEGAGGYFANVAVQQVDPERGLYEGVGQRAAEGLLAGPFGAVAGGMNAQQQRQAQADYSYEIPPDGFDFGVDIPKELNGGGGGQARPEGEAQQGQETQQAQQAQQEPQTDPKYGMAQGDIVNLQAAGDTLDVMFEGIDQDGNYIFRAPDGMQYQIDTASIDAGDVVINKLGDDDEERGKQPSSSAEVATQDRPMQQEGVPTPEGGDIPQQSGSVGDGSGTEGAGPVDGQDKPVNVATPEQVEALTKKQFGSKPAAQKAVSDLGLNEQFEVSKTGNKWQAKPKQQERQIDVVSGEKIDNEWSAFKPESGTLNIERSRMPQVKAENRGAMVNFLKGRGIDSQNQTVLASELKPTQREFSPEKVQDAIDYEGGERSVLISSDNHVIDGHHQWLSKYPNEQIDVIRINAPAQKIIEQLQEMPSVELDNGAQAEGKVKAVDPNHQQALDNEERTKTEVIDQLQNAIPEEDKKASKKKPKVNIDPTQYSMERYAELAYKNNPYKDEYDADPEMKKDKIDDYKDEWKSKVEELAKGKELSLETLDSYYNNFGMEAFNSRFRGQAEKGVPSWYEFPQIRLWDKTYNQVLAMKRKGELGAGRINVKYMHRNAVKNAIEAGAPVPEKVLNEYPELTGKDKPETKAASENTQSSLKLTGKTDNIRTPNDEDVLIEYALIEVDDLIASHDEYGKVNPEYPALFQPRDRTRAASEQQIRKIVNKFYPPQLHFSANTSDGAPIIDMNGVVESGNGRTLAIRKVYKIGDERSQAYKDYLESQGYDLTGFEKPVVVRVRRTAMTDQERVNYTRESNDRTTMGMSPAEQAAVDAETILRIIDDYNGGDVYLASNAGFVRKFMQSITESSRAELMSESGELSQAGIRRIQAALIQAAYGDPELVQVMFESTDDNIKAIGGALLDASGYWAKMVQAEKEGRISKGMDITEHLMGAVRLVMKARKEKRGLLDLINQSDIMTGAVPEMTKSFVRLLYRGEKLNQARSKEKVAGGLVGYATGAMNITDDNNLFGDVVTAEQLLEQQNAAIQKYEEPPKQSTDLFTSSGLTPFGTEKGGRSGQGQEPSTVRKPPEQPATTEDTQEQEEVAPVEDFGEKLGGARKDMPQVKSLDKDLEVADIVKLPLSKIWDKKEIDKIEDQEVAAFMHTLRSEIPAKPRKPYLVKRWAENVKMLRDLGRSYLESKGRILDKMNEPKFIQIKNTVYAKTQLLSGIPRDEWGRIGSVEAIPDAVGGSKVIVRIDGNKEIFDYEDDVLDAVDLVMEKMGQAKGVAKQGQPYNKLFTVRIDSRTNVAFIHRSSDPERTRLMEFDEGEPKSRGRQAWDYAKNNVDALLAKWEEVKAEKNVKKTDIRSQENRPRIGEDVRNGKDATPEMFQSQFSFRGVEFGNWVKQGKGARDRQRLLNDVFDALVDLAALLDIPTKSLSLNGKLGLGIGSRGRGGMAMAHFERDAFVINLTKTKGAGTLAHEWFHALDNYFARNRDGYSHESDIAFITNKPEPMMVLKTSGNERITASALTKSELERRSERHGGIYRLDRWQVDPNHPAGVRKEVEAAFAELVNVLKDSPMYKRASTIDAGKSNGYWSSTIEMAARAFEAYIIAKMEKSGAVNDFLANVVPVELFPRAEERYPYPTKEEMQPIVDAFDNLFNKIEVVDPEGAATLNEPTNYYGGDWKRNSDPKEWSKEDANNYYEDAVKLDADKVVSWAVNDQFNTLSPSERALALRVASQIDDVTSVDPSAVPASVVKPVKAIANRAARYFKMSDFDTDALVNFEMFVKHIQERAKFAANHTLLDHLFDGEPNKCDIVKGAEKAIQELSDEITEAKTIKGNPLAAFKRVYEAQIKQGMYEYLIDELKGNSIEATRNLVVIRYPALSDEVISQEVKQGLTNNSVYEAQTSYGYDQQLAFKEWFGDSKVVDENGDPLVVYHGTSDGGFTVFDSRAASDSDARQNAGDAGLGFFFTEDRALAEQHRDRLDGDRPSWSAANKEVYAVYLSLQNPFVTSSNVTAERRAELEAQGHDGVIYDFGSWKEYVAFRPEQIKSAIGNRGTFDPKDPSIINEKSAWNGTYTRWADDRSDMSASDSDVAGQQTVSDDMGSVLYTQNAIDYVKAEVGQMMVREHIVDISPQQFLEMAEPLESPSESKKAGLKGVSKFDDVPFLKVKINERGSLQVIGHEGRHRAMQLAERGVNKFPIRIILTGDSKYWNRLDRRPQSMISEDGKKFMSLPPATKSEVLSGRYERSLAAKQDRKDIVEQNAWHGSPHYWTKPSLQRIGSGEGAQVFGWGLYLASDKEVAKWYQKTVGYKDVVRQFLSELPEDIDIEETLEVMGEGVFSPKMQRLLEALNADDWLGFEYPAQAITAVFRSPERFEISQELMDAINDYGNLYELDVPENDELLNFNARFNSQPKKVKEALKPFVEQKYQAIVDGIQAEIDALVDEAGKPPTDQQKLKMRSLATKKEIYTNPTGESIYRRLSEELGGDKEASLHLNGMGIKGLRYKDATSRSKSDDNSNYNFVIWDQDAITVKTLNGEMMPINEPKPYSEMDANQLDQAIEQYEQLSFGLNDLPKISKDSEKESRKFVSRLQRIKNSIVANKVSADFKEGGATNLIGKQVNNSHDLALLAQVYRNPAFESMRYFFIRDGKVVGQYGVTSRMAGASKITPNNMQFEEFISYMNNMMEELGADGYYMLHNHPTGRPEPSRADISVTHALNENVKGFLGHIIINNGTYAVIDKVGSYTYGDIPKELVTYDLSKAKIPHPVLKKDINSPQEFAAIATEVYRPDSVAVVGTDPSGKVSGVAYLDRNEVGEFDELTTINFITTFTRQTGSSRVFIANIPHDLRDEMNKLAQAGFIMDYITDKGGVSYITPSSIPARKGVELVEEPNSEYFRKRAKPIVAFGKPEQTLFDVSIRIIGDKFRMLKLLQREIINKGGVLTEDTDVYLAEELFYGRAENDMDLFQETYIEPMTKLMGKYNITQMELDTFLYAKHAPERNKAIAEKRDDMPDGGSGMSTAEANRIILEIRKAGKLEQYNHVAKYVYDMLQANRDLIRKHGLEDDETIYAWEDTYKWYVPLKGLSVDEPEHAAMGTGQGFNIFGRETRSALGRRSRALSPSSYAIADATKLIIRAQKNEVGNALLKLVEANPNPKYWQVFTDENPDMKMGEVTRKDPKTGKRVKKVELVKVPMAMVSRNYFTTKRNGKVYYIKLHDHRIEHAMKNLGPQANNFVIRALASYTRYLSMMNTSLNPEFMITNFARDIQTALFNIMAEETREDGKLKGEKIAAQAVKNVHIAMRTFYRNARGKSPKNKEWEQYLKEFLEDGAKTGYFDMKDLPQIEKSIARMVAIASGGVKGTMLQSTQAAAKFIEDINSAVENAIRLSTYVAARKAGVSRKRAASAAKNLTVNFNRKGEVGSTMTALYMFANASIQGNVNFARAIVTLRPKEKGQIPVYGRLNAAQKIAGGMMIFGFILSALGRAFGGEDDDGVDWWDKIPQYEKERNLIIMESMWGGEEGKYKKIMLPYGYNIFPNIGYSLESIVAGSKTPLEGAGDLVAATLDSFSPIGFSDSEDLDKFLLKNVSPTIIRPVVDIGINENFMGNTIYNVQPPYGVPEPQSSMGRRNTPEAYKQVAKFLNELTGGDEKITGWIDIAPESLEYLVGYVTGGAGNFVFNKVPQNIMSIINQKELPPQRIIFYGRVAGEVLPYADISKFYDRLDKTRQYENQAKTLRGEERKKFLDEYGNIVSLSGIAEQTSTQLRRLRKQRDFIEQNSVVTEEEREKRLEQVERRMKAAVDNFNKRYNETVGK